MQCSESVQLDNDAKVELSAKHSPVMRAPQCKTLLFFGSHPSYSLEKTQYEM